VWGKGEVRTGFWLGDLRASKGGQYQNGASGVDGGTG
jgi:hypothetical protein